MIGEARIDVLLASEYAATRITEVRGQVTGVRGRGEEVAEMDGHGRTGRQGGG